VIDEREASRLLFQDGLTNDDTAWMREQFTLAGLPTPDHDVGWITTEEIGYDWAELPWPLILLLGVPIVAIIVGFILRAFGVQT
jgi:hypothetical protein